MICLSLILSKSNVSRLLEDIERAGEKVLSTRQEIIDLDRRRNSNREAIRGLEKQAKDHYKGKYNYFEIKIQWEVTEIPKSAEFAELEFFLDFEIFFILFPN